MTVLLNAIARNKLYFLDRLLIAGADMNLYKNVSANVKKIVNEMS